MHRTGWEKQLSIFSIREPWKLQRQLPYISAHWYNNDINTGVINHFPVRFTSHGTRGSPYMTLSSDHELLSRLVIDLRGEPVTLMMLMDMLSNALLMTYLYIQRLMSLSFYQRSFFFLFLFFLSLFVLQKTAIFLRSTSGQGSEIKHLWIIVP